MLDDNPIKSFCCWIPVWAIPVITNNDYSGLNDEEAETVDNFLETMYNAGYRNPVFDFQGEPSFRNYPEFGESCEAVYTEVTTFDFQY